MIDSSLVATSIATGYRPYALGIDEALASHQVYSANWGANNVTIIDPPGGNAGPVSVTIDPLPGDTTSSTSPVLSGVAASSRAPQQSNIVAVFYRTDADTTWRRAQIVDGAGTPSVKWQATPSGPLSQAAHTIEVAAMDQALAVSSSSDQGAGGDSAALGGAAKYAFTVGVAQATTDWYVNASFGSDLNLGNSPATPFRSVTRATLAAAAGDTVQVASGLYGTATTGEVFPIRMMDGVLQGAGSGSVTLLGNGADPVIQATGIGSAAKIDGFTIAGGSPGLELSGSSLTISNNVISGNAGGLTGGGIHSVSGSTHIINNLIRANTATYGGGIVIENADSSRIESNTIENNVATQGGGGIDVYLNAKPTISHNVIRNNSALMGGGIISESGSLPRITETVIQGNSAAPTDGGKGGAIACFSGSVVLENCLITGNNSSDYAISGINSAATKIVNCTIADNAPAGIGRFSPTWTFSVEVRNSILRNSGAEIGTGTVATISYSDVEGGFTGAGNIDADPRFVDPPADYRLAAGSPCIDAGAAETTVVSDLDGVARPVGGGWDMGAYESTAVSPPDIVAPAVQITSPSPGAAVSGEVTITALATDERSDIARVEFRVDGVLISSSTVEPFSAIWDASAASVGSHSIQVTAYDGAGNSTSASETVSVSAVDTTPPTVSIMVPTDGTVVSGIVWFGAGAGDVGGSGISRVEFRADGDLFYTAWGGYMYIADWDSTGAAPGPHVIEVTAYDVAGNSASTSITVVILDTIAPKVSITSPEESAVVTGSVAIEAAATDGALGIVEVAFAVDGATVTTDTTAPFSAVWNATGAAVGDHIITVTAYDGAGNSSVATRSVSVTATQPAPTPPNALNRTLGTTTSLSGPSSAWSKKTLKLTGTVAPGGPGTVTITMTRKVGRKWKSAGHVHVSVVNGTYRYSPKPKYKGSWRFVASYSGGVSALDTYRPSMSGTKSVRVK
jgi:parallel beta-helix repeat protein